MPDPDNPKPTQENFAEIVAGSPPVGRPRPSDYLEWSGTTQMVALLTFICVLSLFVLVGWFQTRPSVDAVDLLVKTLGMEGRQGLDPMALLSQMQTNHIEQFKDLYQTVVMSGLVPLFTLLAGYVFGKGKATDSRDQSE